MLHFFDISTLIKKKICHKILKITTNLTLQKTNQTAAILREYFLEMNLFTVIFHNVRRFKINKTLSWKKQDWFFKENYAIPRRKWNFDPKRVL